MDHDRLRIDWQFWLKIVLSLGIALGTGCWVSTQGVRILPPFSELAVLKQNWWGPVGFFLALGGVHILRAYRWVYLLRPLEVMRSLRITTMVAIAFLGFLAIMVFPLRSGEFARPYLIRNQGNITMSSAFATIAIERVIDGLVLSGILTYCLLVMPLVTDQAAWARRMGVATLGIFVAALLVLLALLWKGEPVVDWLERFGSRIWPGFARKMAGVLREFLRGLESLPSLTHLVPFVVMTLAYWGLNGVGMWLLALGCDLHLSLLGGFLVMTMLGVGILLPTGPGHFGNFQVAVWLALSLQGIPEHQMEAGGSVYIFVLYVMILGITVGAGLISLLDRRVTLRMGQGPAKETAT